MARRPRGGVSLRVRLVLVAMGALAVGLLVAGAATFAALRVSLVDHLDHQLLASRRAVTSDLASGVEPAEGAARPIVPYDTYAELRGPDGAVTARISYGWGGSDLRPDLPAAIGPVAEGDEPRRLEVGGDGEGGWRAIVTGVPGGGVLVVAAPLEDVARTLRQLVLVEAGVAAFVLGTVGALAWWLVRIGLRPLERMAATADAIAAGDLSARVADAGPGTEVGRLGIALNAMLARIEAALAQRAASEDRLRRFVADASHELRTPLTAIRGWAELFRRGADRRPDDLATAMRRIEEESARMGVLVDDLLLLARLDQGRPLERQRLDLRRVATDAVADARAVDPGRPIALEVNGPVEVVGDDARLRQVAANLLANALLHTPPESPVRVRAERRGDDAVLLVADAGPGMSPDVADRAFERFYRGDPSRARSAGGTGLGLSIVAAVVAAHGGRVELSAAPGSGTTVEIHLPSGEPPPAPASAIGPDDALPAARTPGTRPTTSRTSTPADRSADDA